MSQIFLFAFLLLSTSTLTTQEEQKRLEEISKMIGQLVHKSQKQYKAKLNRKLGTNQVPQIYSSIRSFQNPERTRQIQNILASYNKLRVNHLNHFKIQSPKPKIMMGLNPIEKLQKDVEIQLKLEKMVDLVIEKGFAKELHDFLKQGLLQTPWKQLQEYEQKRQFFTQKNGPLQQRFDKTMRVYSRDQRDKFFKRLLQRYFARQHGEPESWKLLKRLFVPHAKKLIL